MKKMLAIVLTFALVASIIGMSAVSAFAQSPTGSDKPVFVQNESASPAATSVQTNPFGQSCSGKWSGGGYSNWIELRLAMTDAEKVKGDYDLYPATGGRALLKLPLTGDLKNGTLTLRAPGNDGYNINATVNGKELTGSHYHPVPGFAMEFQARCK